jgi:hypothetical protein
MSAFARISGQLFLEADVYFVQKDRYEILLKILAVLYAR